MARSESATNARPRRGHLHQNRGSRAIQVTGRPSADGGTDGQRLLEPQESRAQPNQRLLLTWLGHLDPHPRQLLLAPQPRRRNSRHRWLNCRQRSGRHLHRELLRSGAL